MCKTLITLWVAVIISGIAVVYVRHQHRLTFIALQESQHERDQLNIEWSQLLLEESTFSVYHWVENKAREKLGMKNPTTSELVVLSGSIE